MCASVPRILNKSSALKAAATCRGLRLPVLYIGLFKKAESAPLPYLAEKGNGRRVLLVFIRRAKEGQRDSARVRGGSIFGDEKELRDVRWWTSAMQNPQRPESLAWKSKSGPQKSRSCWKGYSNWKAKVYRRQIARGKVFRHEHPRGVSSWHMEPINR